MREAEAAVQTPSSGCDGELLRDMDDSLHAMSQPITVLLCTLQYGAGLDSVEEMRPLLLAAQRASDQLRERALAMRVRLQAAMKQA